ncbi:hypothetical protein GA0070621_4743 [Micromonospora narathiwatensis]|uniref:Uncharacterized protein n=1 Tax=Micromonospora narathiwatensis TaxID=299146 RepID=A0A1A9AAW4_9ACTN|nr:hypothetical protein GA0070621_4743 [Micromonospora narathiwatensis]
MGWTADEAGRARAGRPSAPRPGAGVPRRPCRPAALRPRLPGEHPLATTVAVRRGLCSEAAICRIDRARSPVSRETEPPAPARSPVGRGRVGQARIAAPWWPVASAEQSGGAGRTGRKRLRCPAGSCAARRWRQPSPVAGNDATDHRGRTDDAVGATSAADLGGGDTMSISPSRTRWIPALRPQQWPRALALPRPPPFHVKPRAHAGCVSRETVPALQGPNAPGRMSAPPSARPGADPRTEPAAEAVHRRRDGRLEEDRFLGVRLGGPRPRDTTPTPNSTRSSQLSPCSPPSYRPRAGPYSRPITHWPSPPGGRVYGAPSRTPTGWPARAARAAPAVPTGHCRRCPGAGYRSGPGGVSRRPSRATPAERRQVTGPTARRQVMFG